MYRVLHINDIIGECWKVIFVAKTFSHYKGYYNVYLWCTTTKPCMIEELNVVDLTHSEHETYMFFLISLMN